MAETRSESWATWHQDFVVNGLNSDDREKHGTLEYMTQDLKSTYFTLKLQHLGIAKLSAEKAESGSEGIRRLKATLYVEKIEVSGPAEGSEPAAPAAPAPEAAAPKPEGATEDQGARDPAGFPRYPGSVRRSFTASRDRLGSNESAVYVAKSSPAEVNTFFTTKLKELGWEETQRSETGDPLKLTYAMDVRWKKDKQSSRFTLTVERASTVITVYVYSSDGPGIPLRK
jgi:hypothetical protein